MRGRRRGAWRALEAIDQGISGTIDTANSIQLVGAEQSLAAFAASPITVTKQFDVPMHGAAPGDTKYTITNDSAADTVSLAPWQA